MRPYSSGGKASASSRVGSQRAKLTVARKIGRRAYHVLRELDQQEQAA